MTKTRDTRPRTNGRLARGPDDSRIYAIGDVHGRVDLLTRLRDAIQADAAQSGANRRVLVYLGDYVDRGPTSNAVIDLLRSSPLPGFEEIHLLGNHEFMMSRFMEDGLADQMGHAWLYNGGMETLRSYGVVPDGQRSPSRIPLFMGADTGEADLESMAETLSRTLPHAHRDFLDGLRVCHREGDFLFAHAGIRPGVALEDQRPEDLLWIRDGFLEDERDHGAVIVHGHTVCRRPEVRRNRIGVDTGAFMSGELTCVVIEADAICFLATDRVSGVTKWDLSPPSP